MRERLGEFARFGAGEAIAHWGGRLIWQLADVHELLVAWHAIRWAEKARDYEKRLLAHFAELHGNRRPFANLTGCGSGYAARRCRGSGWRLPRRPVRAASRSRST